MSVKLPFTEKFLWDLYSFVSKTEGALSFFITADKPYGFRGLHEMTWPEIKVFKSNWEFEYKKKKKDFAKFIYKLEQNGYIKRLKVKDKSAVMLTPKGLDKVFTIKMKLKEKRQRRDKKWQMVLFDIPEKKRKKRDFFRKSLKYLGYKKLQKSIWVCPHDVLQETKDLIKRYKLESHVELLLVKKIGLG